MKISNLSIVIIAHNEQYALQKCLASIINLDLHNCEIICVDADSTDETAAIALSFKEKLDNYKVLQIKGHQNASIARNTGLSHCTKDHIFFVDGDIELSEEFILAGLLKMQNNDADAVFGVLVDYEYDENYTKVIRVLENRTSILNEENRYYCGGIFMIKKSISDEIGTFNEDFIKGEDFDYTLRTTKKYTLKALPVSMGIHHTIPYTNKTRMKNEIKNNMAVFYGAVMKKNIRNYKGCMAIINKAGWLKGVFVMVMLLSGILWSMLTYVGLLLLALDVAIGIKKHQNIKFRLIEHYQIPLLVAYGFITGIKTIKKPDTHVELIWPEPMI